MGAAVVDPAVTVCERFTCRRAAGCQRRGVGRLGRAGGRLLYAIAYEAPQRPYTWFDTYQPISPRWEYPIKDVPGLA